MSSPAVDDFALTPMEAADRRDFLDLCDDRHLPHPTILTSQLPVDEWRVSIGDPTLADPIPDRMVHHAHRFDLQGDSLRKLRAQRRLAGGDERYGDAGRCGIKRRARYRLVPGHEGFFLAGSESRRTLKMLGDGEFKLFAWICLHAERAAGRLRFERGELAGGLGRSGRPTSTAPRSCG